VTDYAHIVDFLRYLGCEAESVQASSAKLTDQGPDVEDAYVAAIDLRGGGLRVTRGLPRRQWLEGPPACREFNGTDGSLWWDMEDLNRLHVFYAADEKRGTGGFRDILVGQPDHPFSELWWPPGHPLGWEHSFMHQWRDFLSAVIDERPISAEQATFEDGYEAAVLCDAIITSSQEGRRVLLEEMRRPAATTA
jgi:predicted dehydrogenase